MRSLNIHGVNDVRLDPKEMPTPGDSDVVIAVKACGICGSDLSYIKWGGINRQEGGFTPIGHEAAGEVIAVGTKVEGVRLGERVIINPMNTPSFIGSGGPEGAFSEQILVKDARAGLTLLPVPSDISYEVAALSEPLAVALHGVNRADVKSGDKAVVFGCGPIGLGMVLWLVDKGVDVIAVDLVADRLARASALGAQGIIDASVESVQERLRSLHGTNQHFGVEVANTDVYLDAAGAASIVGDVLALAKYQSRLVVTAVPKEPIPVDFQRMNFVEMTIMAAMGYPTEMPEVVAALPRLHDKVASLISHRVPFDNILNGFDIAASPLSAKVMVTF